ncbi:MAG: hypothetical protein H7329_04445, partial [Opitutaceae bacterium]|nr:hypothetical protein [Cytophagales bacterium]
MKKLFTALLSISALASIGQTIPNNDFENWQPADYGNFEEPTGWKTINSTASLLGGAASVTKTTSKFSGAYAANLGNVAVNYQGIDTIFGGILYTDVDIQGKPLPAYLKGNIKYSLAPGEKAIISFGYKTVDIDGNVTESIIGIKSFTGTSATYVPFTIKTNAQYYPFRKSDVLTLTISSYDFWSNNASPKSAYSNLTIDSLGFGGVSPSPVINAEPLVSNGGFDKWYNVEGTKTPDNWFQANLLQFSDTNAVTQSSDSRNGAYALKLGINPAGSPAFVYTFIKPGVNDKNVIGYAKYLLGPGDTAVAYLSKYSKQAGFEDNPIDSVIFTGNQDQYKGFSLKFNGKVKLGDTLGLQFAAYNPVQFNNFRLEANSFFLVDDITLSAFPLAIDNELDQTIKLSVSPNPSANGVFNINSDNVSGLKVYDVFGNQVEANLNQTSDGTIVDISSKPKGV